MEGSVRLEGNLRGLKIAVVVMGVLIIAATAVLVAAVVHRAMAPQQAAFAPALPDSGSSVTLDEPAGTRIAGVTQAGAGLAVLLQGGGPDRVVLLDPSTGRPSLHIGLAR
jgi:hypothetical protein